MIQSVERAFRLLYTIGQREDQSNISQLARDVGLPRTTVVRLLDTLQAVGAVKTADVTDEYQIGDKLVALLNNTPWKEQLAAVAYPYLQELALTTGETTYLGIPEGNSVFYMTQIDSQYTIQMKDWSGQYTDLHPTAAGKLFLAYRTPEELDRFFEQELATYTEFTLTSPHQLRPELNTIRQTQISWSREEFEFGCINIAAPIFNRGGQITAAVAIGFPRYRMQSPEHQQWLAEQLLHTGQQISQSL